MLVYCSYHSLTVEGVENFLFEYLNTKLNIQRTNLVSEMTKRLCVSLSSSVRLSNAEGGVFCSKNKNLV